MLKRFGRAALWLCCVAGAPALGATAFELGISGPPVASPGEIVSFAYRVNDNRTAPADLLVGLDLELTYDPLVLSLVDARSTLFTDYADDPLCLFECFTWLDTGAQVNIDATSLFGLAGSPIELLTLDFRVLGGAPAGPIALGYGAAELSTDPTVGGGAVLPGDVQTTGATLTIARVPLPPSWLLLVPGVLALSGLRQRQAARHRDRPPAHRPGAPSRP